MYTDYSGFRDISFRPLAGLRHLDLSARFRSTDIELRQALDEQARLMLLTGYARVGKAKLRRDFQATLDETWPCWMSLLDGPDSFGALQGALRELCGGGDGALLLVGDAHALGCDVLKNDAFLGGDFQ